MPIVVVNRVGASGAIGSREAAHSQPDGYTLQVATSSSLIIYPSSTSTPLYDPVNDFTPIAYLAKLSATICVRASLPVKTLREFVDLLKANPGKYPYGSGGNGSFVHLAAELFKMHAGLKRNFQVMPGAEWLELLCKHIPDRYEHLVRYVGWYSNRARGERAKALKTLKAPDPATKPAASVETVSAFATRAKATWARLIREVLRASSRRVTTLDPHPRPLSRVAGEGSLVMQMDCHPFA